MSFGWGASDFTDGNPTLACNISVVIDRGRGLDRRDDEGSLSMALPLTSRLLWKVEVFAGGWSVLESTDRCEDNGQEEEEENVP